MARADAAPWAVDTSPATRELTALMGCRGSVTVLAGDPAVANRLLMLAEARLRELESRWSRFLADSEISRLARGAGASVAVSAPTRLLVRHLVEAWQATDGLFDPRRLPELVGLGYAASVLDPERRTTLPPGSTSTFSVDAVRVDDSAGTVRLPVGATLDPGGLGKGLAADLVAAELIGRGADGAMVEIGGDLRVAGESPSRAGWRIDVEDPIRPDGPALAVVAIGDGGVATSSRLLRTLAGGGHHLLDPSSGRPATTDLVAATVVTSTGGWSEAYATAAVVAGLRVAQDLLEADGVAALLCLADGSIVATSEWATVSAS